MQPRREALDDLLNEYKQNPSKEKQKELHRAIETVQEDVNKFEEHLRQEVQNLLSSHPHAEEFAGKLSFENGKVVITDYLSFRHQIEIYLPSIIDKIEGSLYLERLRLAEHLELPDIIEGSLNLSNLESAENLELPDRIEAPLNLNNLKSAKYLELPDKIEGDLYLRSLKSSEHLELHDNIKGDIYLDSLSRRERKQLQNEYPNLADQITTF